MMSSEGDLLAVRHNHSIMEHAATADTAEELYKTWRKSPVLS